MTGIGILSAMLAVAPGAISSSRGDPSFATTYLYSLSTVTGRLAQGWLEVSYDPQAREVYAFASGAVRIFADSGMEVFKFRGEPQRPVNSLVALEDGDLAVLTTQDGRWALVRCDYRGEPLAPIVPTSAPADFNPDQILYANGLLYVADRPGMKVLVLDLEGAVRGSYDLAQRLGFDDAKRSSTGLTGFNVDAQGRFLFTIAPLFKAYVMDPKGEYAEFGRAGGAPGLFNIVTGIAADASGNLYLADTLKSAIIVFDKDFRFLTEFGYRGVGPGQLIAPRSIAVGGDKLFVAQGGNRGVAVFAVGRR
jgi:hypothetical protein